VPSRASDLCCKKYITAVFIVNSNCYNFLVSIDEPWAYPGQFLEIQETLEPVEERGWDLFWLDWIGMGGRISPESVDGLPRNTQLEGIEGIE
jgi:hypothetical protein